MSLSWKSLRIAIVAALVIVSVCRDGNAESSPPFKRVRAADPLVLASLVQGHRHSPTFRRLLDALEASDLVVHVVRSRATTGDPGAMQFVTRAGGQRYVRITIDGGTSEAMIALLGHELQHAVEVANAPWVVDASTCLELYLTIGHPSCAGPRWCFDTIAAVNAGRQVLFELRRHGSFATD